MPSSVSFLQAASAKIDPMLAPSLLQLLLVEDEEKTSSYSLAMDTAYSLASAPSSSMQCRGCGFFEQNSCRCCSIAMLVTRSKQVMINQNLGQHQSKPQNSSRADVPFPLTCHEEGEERNTMDQSALDRIQIRYVNSIQDVIRYLVYAPSLPKHLIPDRGIFILGLGDLISREQHSGSMMELTHVLSMLSDTGCILDEIRSGMIGSSDDSNEKSTTLMATLNQQIHSSLPQNVYKQMGFSVASIQTGDHLVFEEASSRNSISFSNENEEIIWSVK